MTESSPAIAARRFLFGFHPNPPSVFARRYSPRVPRGWIALATLSGAVCRISSRCRESDAHQCALFFPVRYAPGLPVSGRGQHIHQADHAVGRSHRAGPPDISARIIASASTMHGSSRYSSRTSRRRRHDRRRIRAKAPADAYVIRAIGTFGFRSPRSYAKLPYSAVRDFARRPFAMVPT